MKKISARRFEAYTAFTKNPLISLICEEIAWYENDSHTILATICIDYTDRDFNVILMGRDESGKVRAFDQIISLPTLEEAEAKLQEKAKEYEKQGRVTFEQGSKEKPCNLFQIEESSKKYNPAFDKLNASSGYSPAKELIQELIPHFYDVDGNFKEQFQTQGFDARLWELFLLCYFNEEAFDIDRTHNAPDFMLSYNDIQVGIEAVIASRQGENQSMFSCNDYNDFMRQDIDLDQMAITWGSPLYSKMQHRTKKDNLHYWEYEHTKNHPFVLAVADFSSEFSMLRSNTALVNYLYAQTVDFQKDVHGNVVPTPKKIEKHIGTKEIPSGFFVRKMLST